VVAGVAECANAGHVSGVQDVSTPIGSARHGRRSRDFRNGVIRPYVPAEPDRPRGTASQRRQGRSANSVACRTCALRGRPIPHTQIPLETLWEHAPEAAKVFTWANERYFDTDLTPLRHVHPGLMDFTGWLNRTGKARLLAQLESASA
jgi:hypothetical protein